MWSKTISKSTRSKGAKCAGILLYHLCIGNVVFNADLLENVSVDGDYLSDRNGYLFIAAGLSSRYRLK